MKIHLRAVFDDGKVYECDEPVIDGWDAAKHLEVLDYMWDEGNYACDCNRRAFRGEDVEGESDECGETILVASVDVTIDGVTHRLPMEEEALRREHARGSPA